MLCVCPDGKRDQQSCHQTDTAPPEPAHDGERYDGLSRKGSARFSPPWPRQRGL
jgi:hypothetical protein